MRNSSRHLVGPLLALLALACSASSTAGPASNNGVLAVGKWGSRDMALEVTASEAKTRFDFCADGTIKVPIFLDPDGRFDAEGTYVRNIGPSVQARSARYIGIWRPTSLTVTIVLGDPIGPNDSDVVGPFDLLPNAPGPEVRPCPIEY